MNQMVETLPQTIPISQIVIGDRVRKDMGDLASLAESIKRSGLLHPVVVLADKTLVAGHRRIEAARLLGWSEIPVTVVEVNDLLSAERDENEERKDFTPTEAVAIGKLIEERVRPVMEQRRREGASRGGARLGKASVNFTEPSETRDIVGSAVGMSGVQYQRAKAVVTAAEKNPEKFGDLPAKMDETGIVASAYREMQERSGAAPKRKADSAQPKGPFVPQNQKQEQSAKAHYRRMVEALASVRGACVGLESLDPGKCAYGCPQGEAADWFVQVESNIKTLRRFVTALKGASE